MHGSLRSLVCRMVSHGTEVLSHPCRRGGRSLCESGPYKAHQVIHGAVHQVHEVIQRSLIANDSAIQQANRGSLNCNYKGSNELPYDKVLQGAAHQAPQGFVICSVSFELPGAACELPRHSAIHRVAHGAIHMHHAIHGLFVWHFKERCTPYMMILLRSLMNHHNSISLGNSPCFRLRTRRFTMLCKAFALSSVFH